MSRPDRRPAKPDPDVLPSAAGRLAFGPFRLDPARRTLHRNGIPVPLTARLFETLLYLAQHPGRLVTRDELEHAVWRGRAVEDGNLQKAISSLRKALQTDTPGEAFILTIAGHGFRFTAPVTLEPCDDSAAAITGAPAASPARPQVVGTAETPWHWPRRIVLSACIAAALLASAATVWRLALRSAPAFSPPPHSVAVLPFVNMSGDAHEEYFSDGLADELINTLSRVHGLRVAARTSAFSFKASQATIGDIGRRLNVAAILEGAVRRDGQQVHIAVQLIDARTGFQFWSRSYDRDRLSGDAVKVQIDIAETVSASLEVRLLHTDAERLTVGGTHDAKALDAHLRGMNDSFNFGEAPIRQTIADFSEAIARDPAYAQAFAGRASAYNFLVVCGYEKNADADRHDAASAEADADRAIGLAPRLAEAHRVKSIVLFNALAFKQAADEVAIATDLAPDDAMVASTSATIEARLGHDQAATAAARHAIALDPLNPNAYQRLGQALYWTRHFAEALEAFEHAAAVNPHPSRINQSWIASAYLAKGDAAAAEHICAGGDGWTDDACLAMAYHALGRQHEADAKFASLIGAFGDRGAYIYAEIDAQWGRPEEALRWLRMAYALKNSGLGEMQVSPFLDPIRRTAEFTDIERGLKFPP